MSRKPLAAPLCAAAVLVVASPASAQVPLPAEVPPLPAAGAIVSDPAALLEAGGLLDGAPLPGAAAPPPAIGSLLDSVAPTSPPTSSGPPAVGAPVTPAVALDTRAPTVRLTVRSRLRRVLATRRLKLRVAADEASVVALAVTARGRRVRRVLRFAPVLLAFRAAGSVTTTLRLTRAQRRALRRARSVRLTVRVFAVDVARNQATSQVRRRVRR